jgi:hypothetical protein
MKEDAEAKIVRLESELLRWQSDYAALAESEKHLQVERDRYRARLRASGQTSVPVKMNARNFVLKLTI